jgi:hypothetical protein
MNKESKEIDDEKLKINLKEKDIDIEIINKDQDNYIENNNDNYKEDEKKKLLNNFNKNLKIDLKPDINTNINPNIESNTQYNPIIGNIDIDNIIPSSLHGNENENTNKKFNLNANLQKNPLERFLDLSKIPRFQQKLKEKEISYRTPTYISNNDKYKNYKTIKPIEPKDDEIFENEDSDLNDPMFLEGKKDITNKVKIKVI